MGNSKNDVVDKMSTKIDRCRICGKNELQSYFNLGEFPLPNNLCNTQEEAINVKRFTLDVNFCNNCKLSQLSEVIDPRILYSYYTYKSGISQGYIDHCKELAITCKEKYNLSSGTTADFMIDIASNECTLLEQFRNEIKGIRLLGIDPAKNLCKICREKGINAIDEFFGVNTAIQTLISYGKAQVITATNVFAHVSNPREFLLAANLLLNQNGVLILEFPYLVETIKNVAIGQVYFEHLSYFNITPLNILCQETGFKIISVEKFEIHEGSVRVVLAHDYSNRVVESSVQEFLDKEEKQGFNDISKYQEWKKEVFDSVDDLNNLLKILKQDKKIAAIGASAKGNTLLNLCKIDYSKLDYIVDDTPEKQGKFSPGTGIPIVSKDELINNPPDYLVVLAWNFKDEIMNKLKDIYKGRYIIPLPKLEII